MLLLRLNPRAWLPVGEISFSGGTVVSKSVAESVEKHFSMGWAGVASKSKELGKGRGGVGCEQIRS